MKKIVSLRNIIKCYGKPNQEQTIALDDISFDVFQGEFIGIMGASGSGKSTLLNVISTLDQPTSGKVWVDNKDLSQLQGSQLAKFRGRQVGFIFQDYSLLDNLTAFENIAVPLSLQGVNSKKIVMKIKKIAKRLEIETVLEKYPSQLSGGQKQRVAASRALVGNPRLLFGDEPTGALDSKNTAHLLRLMANINRDSGVSILMVTHDPYTASFCNRILFIKDGRLHKEILIKDAERVAFHHEIVRTINHLERVDT